MPQYKHKDRSKKEDLLWYFEYQYKGIRRKQSGFKDRDDARDAETADREKLKRQLSGDYEIEDNMAEHIQVWLNGRRNLSDNTRSVYQMQLDTHIKPFFNKKAVNQIKATDVQLFLNSLYDKNLSSATVKKAYNIVNKYYNDLLKRQEIKYNPCNGVEKPKETNKKIEVLDEKELKEFLEFAEGYTRYAFAFRLAAHTGLRRGELLALQWRDIDLDRKTINVRKRLVRAAMGTDRYMQEGTKTSIGRFVAFSEQMKQDIIKHKEMQKIEQETNKYEDNDLVIATQNGKFLSVDNFSRIFRHTLKSSPVNKTLSFHAIRHTHATLMLKAGVQMKVVSERLGHSSIKITMDTYAHLLPSMETEAIEKFERLFE